MKTSLLILALAFSLALHGLALFTPPISGAQPKPQIIPVELVTHMPPPEPEPEPLAPQPGPDVAPEPEPEPQPERKPKHTPQPENTVKPAAPQPQSTPAPKPVPAPIPTAAGDDGSLAGSSQGKPQPRLRIDWLDADQARQAIATGRLKLAIINMTAATPLVHEVLIDTNGRAQRTALKPDTTGYHAEVRNVTHVDAFAHWVRQVSIKPNEHFILILPRNLASRIRLQQRQAVQNAGLSWDQGSTTTGQLLVRGSQLTFNVTHIQAHEHSAKQ